MVKRDPTTGLFPCYCTICVRNGNTGYSALDTFQRHINNTHLSYKECLSPAILEQLDGLSTLDALAISQAMMTDASEEIEVSLSVRCPPPLF